MTAIDLFISLPLVHVQESHQNSSTVDDGLPLRIPGGLIRATHLILLPILPKLEIYGLPKLKDGALKSK